MKGLISNEMPNMRKRVSAGAHARMDGQKNSESCVLLSLPLRKLRADKSGGKIQIPIIQEERLE